MKGKIPRFQLQVCFSFQKQGAHVFACQKCVCNKKKHSAVKNLFLKDGPISCGTYEKSRLRVQLVSETCVPSISILPWEWWLGCLCLFSPVFCISVGWVYNAPLLLFTLTYTTHTRFMRLYYSPYDSLFGNIKRAPPFANDLKLTNGFYRKSSNRFVDIVILSLHEIWI